MTNKETAVLFDTKDVPVWFICQKTKPIKAKHVKSLLADKSVTAKLLVATIEGNEQLGSNAMICLGEARDIWQQDPKKLIGKYDVTGIDEDGWLICTPKPDVEVNCKQITGIDNYFIIGLWGQKRTVEGKEVVVQYGEDGDYLLQSQSDATDFWIVKKSLFESTYALK